MKALALSIHPDDSAEFAKLPDEVKTDVREWQVALEPALTAKRRGVAIAAAAQKLGVSVTTARRKFDLALVIGWRAFVNHSKVPAEGEKLPAEFVKFWKKLCGENQRKTKPAYRELKRLFRADESFPGYADDELPRNRKTAELPRGWSYRNLVRHRPTKAELAMVQVGKALAAQYRPLVFTSRVGLKHGEFFLFDDHEFNLKVNFPGNPKAMRPRMFGCVDLLTAYELTPGFKPTLWNAKEQKKEALKERDFMWYVVFILTTVGYRTDEVGTTFVVESGTAAIRAEFEERIRRATSGHVKVDRGTVDNSPAIAGMFKGPSRGNPRFKALRESLFNLIDNEFAALPGQVGKDRNHCPDELAGREAYNNKLLKAALILPEERAALLEFPLLWWGEFTRLGLDIFDRINRRDDHELEGWERCEFLSKEWRPSESLPWLPKSEFDALPDEDRKALSIILGNPSRELTQVRRMQPAEAWQVGCNELTPLPNHMLPELLGGVDSEFAEVRTVRGGHITIEDQDAWPDPLRYLANIDGEQLDDGQEVVAFFNPFRLQELVICNARGSYLGTLPLRSMPTRRDAEAHRREIVTSAKIEAKAMSKLGIRHADQVERRAEMHAHNAAVLRGAPITPLEKSRATADRERAVDMTDFLPAEGAPESSDAADAGSFLETATPTARDGGRAGSQQEAASAADFL